MILRAWSSLANSENDKAQGKELLMYSLSMQDKEQNLTKRRDDFEDKIFK